MNMKEIKLDIDVRIRKNGDVDIDYFILLWKDYKNVAIAIDKRQFYQIKRTLNINFAKKEHHSIRYAEFTKKWITIKYR